MGATNLVIARGIVLCSSPVKVKEQQLFLCNKIIQSQSLVSKNRKDEKEKKAFQKATKLVLLVYLPESLIKLFSFPFLQYFSPLMHEESQNLYERKRVFNTNRNSSLTAPVNRKGKTKGTNMNS